jgi:lactobin A/cerein 7B family class IIb bacteriocin
MIELTNEELEEINGGILPVLIAGVSLLESAATLAGVAIMSHKLYQSI